MLNCSDNLISIKATERGEYLHTSYNKINMSCYLELKE